MENKSIGVIEILRPNGKEIWNLEYGQFSIDKPTNKFRLNFWVQSDINYIQKLDDTGCNPISFELTIPLVTEPIFYQMWKYKFPEQQDRREDDGHFENFYYYAHDSLQDIEIGIIKASDNTYKIEVLGNREDPIDFRNGMAKYKVIAVLPLKTVFEGKWDE